MTLWTSRDSLADTPLFKIPEKNNWLKNTPAITDSLYSYSTRISWSLVPRPTRAIRGNRATSQRLGTEHDKFPISLTGDVIFDYRRGRLGTRLCKLLTSITLIYLRKTINSKKHTTLLRAVEYGCPKRMPTALSPELLIPLDKRSTRNKGSECVVFQWTRMTKSS